MRKKGVAAQNMLIILVITVAILVSVTFIALAIYNWVLKAGVENQCRITIASNAKIRFKDASLSGLIFGSGKDKERIPVNCPRLDDLTITMSDVEGHSKTKAARKFYIMKIIADEMKGCNHRYIADIPDAVPFSSDLGKYCGICREINFDSEVNETFKVDSTKTDKIDYFVTYLMNAKIQGTDQYYSDYLYGFSKDTSERIDFVSYIEKRAKEEGKHDEFNRNRALIEKMDFTIDPSKSYYVMHLILKGDNVVAEAIHARTVEVVGTTAAAAGFCGISYIVTIASAASGQWYATPIAGLVSLGCLAAKGYTIWTVFKPNANKNEKQAVVRFTALIPKEQYEALGCQHTYGMERAKQDDV